MLTPDESHKGPSSGLYSSLSRIEDLDVASETGRFMRTQIRMQAGVALLVQSREMSSESVLRLLR